MRTVKFNPEEQFVITISREIGSGGRTIGVALAERLGVRFCDKQIIEGLKKHFGMEREEIDQIKGRRKNWFLDLFESAQPDAARPEGLPAPLLYERAPAVAGPSVKELWGYEQKIIRSLAEESSCVIAGRSAFHVLKDHPNKLDLFFVAPIEMRIENVMRRQDISEDAARRIVAAVDEGRDNYVKRICGRSRNDARNYDLVMDVGNMDTEGAVQVILSYIANNR